MSAFKYPGITFSSATCLAGTAAPARAKAAGAAVHNCRARCAALGIEAASAQLQLFGSLVDSVLSYCAEVWGPQLAAKAASGNGNTFCAAERLHLSFLRHMLGVRQGTPNAVVLAETGQRPLWARWLLRATRQWNRALAAPPDSLLRQAVLASTALAAEPGSRSLARQPWAQQLAATLAAVGVQLDLADPQPVSRAAVRAGCQERQFEQLMSLPFFIHSIHFRFKVCVPATKLAIQTPKRQPGAEGKAAEQPLGQRQQLCMGNGHILDTVLSFHPLAKQLNNGSRVNGSIGQG